MMRSVGQKDLLLVARHRLVLARADIGYAGDRTPYPPMAVERIEAIVADITRAERSLRQLLERHGALTPQPEIDEIPF